MGDAGQDGWIVDLVPVQVEYGQNSSIGDRVQKLGAMPT